MRRVPRFLALLSPVLAAACAESGAPSTVVTRDSAGIPIIENQAPSPDEERWAVSATPLFQVGAAGGADGAWFGSVMGMTRLADGTVVVADMVRSRVAYYAADGTFVRAAGRRGEGPGEFRQIRGIHRLRGDSVLVEDFNGFASVLAPDGSFARALSFGAGENDPAPFGILGPLGDGRYAAARSIPIGPDGAPDSAYIYRLDPNGLVEDTILTYPTLVRMGAMGPVQTVFTIKAMRTTGGGQLYNADPMRGRIEVRGSDGRVERIIAMAWPASDVTEDDVAQYRENLVGRPDERGNPVPQALRAQRERIMAEAEIAERHPYFLRMLADNAGNLWVQDRSLVHQLTRSGGFQPTVDTPSRWSVFDSDGVRVGAVELPPSFRLLEAGADYVLGLARDESGVEQVRVYGLQPGE